MFKPVALLTVLLAAGADVPVAGEAHQHGVAQMTVAVDGNTMVVDFVSPMENLVGFEHAPRNVRERNAIQALKDRFLKPEGLLAPSPDAGCRAEPVALELPDDRHGDGHADMSVTIPFRCKEPAALKGISLRLFDAFPRLERVKVQFAGPGRQAAAELSRKRPHFTW